MRRLATAVTLEPSQSRYSEATRDKLLEAAGRAFAERGYASATVRGICKDAGANVAAVNYYFKDKLALYAEVLDQVARAAPVARMRAVLDQNASPEDILRDVIRARLRGLHGQKLPDWHFRIAAREFAQPTPAMSRVIDKVMRPIYERLLEVVGKIIGRSPDHEQTRLCTHSIMGQLLLYVLAGPVLMRLWPAMKMTPEQLDRVADHIADFSLAYLRQVGASHRQPARIESARRRK
jgi:TetR/AcrR family transcriptional regulator, regulator of cefoperazone and chloramphenicol sensitivity